MSDSTRIPWTCETCSFPIADGDGCIGVPVADISTRRDLRWSIQHDACRASFDVYGIDVELIRTHRDVTSWTSHLMGKAWFPRSTWGDVLSTAMDCEAAV